MSGKALGVMMSVDVVAAPAAITASTAPAGGTGATAGAYDSAANRNLMIASLTATQVDVAALRVTVANMLTALKELGLMDS